MDINQISFGIKGSAQQATKSLGTLVNRLETLNASFNAVTQSGAAFTNVLSSIASLSNSVKTGLAGTTTTAKTTNTAMAKVVATTQKASTQLKTAKTETTGLNTAMRGVEKTTRTTTSGMSKLIQRITQITFLVYVARRALAAFGAGIQSAIAYVENLNLFMVALGTNTSRATSFIKEMSDSLYLDEAQLTRVQGLFYQISEALGLGAEKAYTLSENFTKLAYDLASFYNITIDAAVTKLQAGLVGETEPLRRIGIIITENNLAETARNLGIKKSIRNMTEQEKIQLRYITALQQTKNAQGDLARTLEQPENLLRILREQFHVFTRELGNAAIPLLKQLIPQVIGLTMALSKLAKAWAESMGYDAPVIRNDLGGYMKTIADESDDTEKKTSKTAKNLAKILKYTRETATSMTGIDELNVISDSSTSSGIDALFPADDLADATGSIDLALKDYNNRMDETGDVFDDVITKWENFFKKIKDTFKGTYDDTALALKEFTDVLFGTKDGADPLESIATVLRTIDAIIAGIIIGITDIVQFFKDWYTYGIEPILSAVIPYWLEDLLLGELGVLRGTVAFLTKAFVVWKAVKFTTSFLNGITGLMGLAPHATTLGVLAGALAGLSLIKFGIDWDKSISDIEKSTMFGELISALINGFSAFGLTGNPVLGAIVFTISLTIKPFERVSHIIDTVMEPLREELVAWAEKYPVAAKVLGIDKVRDETSAPQNVSEYKKVRGYANGGTPTKGELFVAGEAGPELVTEHNGQTVVMNEKQLKERGISFFAKGVNVPKWNMYERAQMQAPSIPKWTAKEQRKAGGSDTVTNDLNKVFNFLPKILGDFFKKMTPKGFKMTDGAKEAVRLSKVAMDKAVMFWEGLKKTDMVQGIVKVFGKFKDQLKDGTGILGKTYKSMRKVANAAGNLVLSAFESFKDRSIRQIFTQGVTGGGTTIQQQEVAGGIIGGALGDTGNIIFGLMQSIADGSLGSFIDSLPLFVEAGIDMLKNLITGIVAALPELMKAIPQVIAQIVDLLTNKDSLNMIIQGLIQAMFIIVTYLPDIIFAIVDAIPDIIMTLIEVFIQNLPMFLKLGIAIGVAILEGIANLLIGGVNGLISTINGIIPGSKWDIPKIPKADFSGLMPKFAEGGFPVQGQMFIAREAGAELVGNVGGSTAVMNNDQIVQAVSDGVYRAVVSANREQGQQKVVVNMSGRRVSETLDQVDKNRGLVFGTGGY